jgi:hypothetical protein
MDFTHAPPGGAHNLLQILYSQPRCRKATHTYVIAPITLPNLHHFNFRGVSTYLEALVHRITAPRLEKLTIEFFNQLTFSVPRLLQFIDTAEEPQVWQCRINFFRQGR